MLDVFFFFNIARSSLDALRAPVFAFSFALAGRAYQGQRHVRLRWIRQEVYTGTFFVAERHPASLETTPRQGRR